MTLVMPALVTLTLLVCGTVALVPDLWGERAPRLRQPPATASLVKPIWVVRSGSGRWYLNGEPIRDADLAQRLARHAGGDVHLLVSARLSSAEATRSLRWLRSHGGRAVVLELPARSL
ncbi:MAG: hypothetical protein ACK46L_11585 [Synechococcaceae cyanobacterium]|jgi:hypothetical protein